jgi:DNA-binding HxlR family transcriptional regulator
MERAGGGPRGRFGAPDRKVQRLHHARFIDTAFISRQFIVEHAVTAGQGIGDAVDTGDPVQRAITARDIGGRFQELQRRAASLLDEVQPLVDAKATGDPSRQVALDLEVLRGHLGKWSLEIVLVLYALSGVGFEELRRQLRGISPRVLSGKLKTLERRGLVLRSVVDTRPPRVEYRLSADGLTLARLTEPSLLYLRFRGK